VRLNVPSSFEAGEAAALRWSVAGYGAVRRGWTWVGRRKVYDDWILCSEMVELGLQLPPSLEFIQSNELVFSLFHASTSISLHIFQRTIGRQAPCFRFVGQIPAKAVRMRAVYLRSAFCVLQSAAQASGQPESLV